MQFSDSIGQHNPAQIGAGNQPEARPAPEMGVELLMRVRFWIVCDLFGLGRGDGDEGAVPA